MNRLFAWIDDRAHPIVLKELRQAAQGRFLSGVLLTMVLVQLGAVILFLLDQGLDSTQLLDGGGYGEDVFRVLVIILLILGGLCLPIYTAARFITERGSEGLALLFISTLSPKQVITGKVISNLVLGGLMICLCLPFMSFTYFLRGIDLPTIAVTLAAVAISIVSAVVMAIFVAALPAERLMRILVLGGGLIALLWWFIWSMIIAMMTVESGDLTSEFGDEMVTLVWLVINAAVLRLLFLLSVAMVAPKVSNRARPVRLYLTLLWIVGALGATWASVAFGYSDPLEVWGFLSLTCFSTGMVITTTAPDRISRRLRDELPKPFWRRCLAFLFTSGSANGLLWAGLGVLGTMIWIGFTDFRQKEDLLVEGMGFFAFVLAYSLLAIRLQRGKLAQKIRRDQTWVLLAALVAVGSLLPPVFLFPFSMGSSGTGFESGLWLLLNPFAVGHGILGPLISGLGVVLALIMFRIQYRWLRDQIVDFFRANP